MRNLFICLILVALVWVTKGDPEGFLGVSTSLGLFVFLPVVMAHWFERFMLPSHLGTLLAGLAIGSSNLIPAWEMASLQVFASLGGVFLCLHVGALLSPYIFLNQRILQASALVIGITFLVVTTTLIAFWNIPIHSVIHLGLICAVTAPIFTLLSYSDRKEGLMVSTATTAIALLLLGVFRGFQADGWPEVTVKHVLIYLVFLEFSYRTLRQIHTEHGRYLLLGSSSVLIFLAAKQIGLAPEFFALLTGYALRIRGGRGRLDQLESTRKLSRCLIPFVLAYLAAKTVGPISLLKGYEWQFILTFSFAMYIGKGLSAWVASKFLTLSGRDWLQLMPHGLFAILLLQNGLPEDLLTSSPAATVSAAILLNSVGISLLLPVLQFFLEKIKIRHLEAVEDP